MKYKLQNRFESFKSLSTKKKIPAFLKFTTNKNIFLNILPNFHHSSESVHATGGTIDWKPPRSNIYFVANEYLYTEGQLKKGLQDRTSTL